MIRIVVLAVALIAIVPPRAGAGDPGTVATDVFVFGRSARCEALAAGVALPGDAGSLVRNPAGLADAEHVTLVADYRDWYIDTSFGHAGVLFPAPWRRGTFAASVVRMSEGRVRDLDLAHGTYGDAYDNGSLGVLVGYGQTLPWWGDVDAGLSGLFMTRTLLDQTASGFGVGGGAAAGLWDDAVRAGLSFRYIGDVTGDVDGVSHVSPWSVTWGITLRAEEFLPPAVEVALSADMVKERNADVGRRAGFEITVFDALSLRVGYDPIVEDAPIRYGIGVKGGPFELDLVTTDHEALGWASGLSLTFRAGAG